LPINKEDIQLEKAARISAQPFSILNCITGAKYW